MCLWALCSFPALVLGIIIISLRKLCGAKRWCDKIRVSTLLAFIIGYGFMANTLAMNIAPALYVDKLCVDFDTYVLDCSRRFVRVQMIHLASGMVAIAILLYAGIQALLKLHRMEAEPEPATIDRGSCDEITEDQPRCAYRTKILFEYLRTGVLAAGLRDCLGYCVFFMIGPQP